ncbi:MAG TPA: hypothetical protein PLJ62_04270 [Thermoflexales bacterium]|nr:hypothetical protein [Thermoflexales bacterium]HQW36853.1 hypothetical protein [Thermoflexales bacterium]HQZ99395.1 hypothetical protein [Thermoflexales bacterium]
MTAQPILIGVIALLVIVPLIFVSMALFAPFEALSWWAGWDDGREEADQPLTEPQSIPRDPAARHFIVYLSGVGRISGDLRPEKEEAFLNRLQTLLPEFLIVREVFPFSVTNEPLTGRRLFGWFWRWVANSRSKRVRSTMNRFVEFRNLTQVAVSADRRYGPVYSFGIAKEITRALLRHGYRVGEDDSVTLMCISGGGQVSVGTAPYLAKMLGKPIRVLSIGGVLTDDPGIKSVEKLVHLSGSKDGIQYIGKYLFPGRWPFFQRSAWNRAVAKGKIRVVDVGPMHHMGLGDYFSRSVKLPDGTSYAEHTADVIAREMREMYAS